MTTIKSYTDLSQSKTLSKILPIESADMYWSRCTITDFGDNILKVSYAVEPCDISQFKNTDNDVPCWSLAALLSVLPAECECMSLEHINYGNNHKKYFMSYVGGGNTDIYDNPIDACVAMIERLHELKML